MVTMNRRVFNLIRFFGIVVLAAVLAIVSSQPAEARFCACCSEPGDWYETSGAINDSEFSMIGDLKVYRVARLFTTEAFPDGFKGFKVPDGFIPGDDYIVSVSQNGRRWRLSFKQKDGEKGTLVFTLPGTAVRVGADLTANVREEIKDPVAIYKELRFKGVVSGTGMFTAGNAPGTRFVFTLQGYGNNCASSSDFHSWTLAVSGPRASYRFYGAFEQ